jgi:hypothetical protein
MVAARAANQALDVSTASELGSLLHAHVRIQDPRWRLEAIVRLVPVLRRFGISIERFRQEIRSLASRARCPRSARAPIEVALVAALDIAPARALVCFTEALFTPSWRGSAMHAIAGALAMEDRELALSFVGEQRYVADELRTIIATGVVDGELVACLAKRGAEEDYVPSVELLHGLVATIRASNETGRAKDSQRLASRLRPRDASIASALLARIEPTRREAELRIRSIREPQIRCLGRLGLARVAIQRGDLDEARHWAASIERPLPRERAQVDIAATLVADGREREALAELKRVLHPRLWSENVWLRSAMRYAKGRPGLRWWRVSKESWDAPRWACVEPTASVAHRMDIDFGAALLSVAEGHTTCIEDGLSFLGRHVALRDRAARVIEERGIDLSAAVLLTRTPRIAKIGDALQSALIAHRAKRLDTVSLPAPFRDAVDGHAPTVGDSASLERATYDEGLALSSQGARRRRVLIGVAQHCVRSALARPEAWSGDVVNTRLRTLVHLGGDLGTGAIRTALATQPAGAFSRAALEALCIADLKLPRFDGRVGSLA